MLIPQFDKCIYAFGRRFYPTYSAFLHFISIYASWKNKPTTGEYDSSELNKNDAFYLKISQQTAALHWSVSNKMKDTH